jgi:riboflavin kinase/FMN adenylyltransferase
VTVEASICIGVFDGVHRGHQRLLAATRSDADTRGLEAVAIVLDPPPIELLQPGTTVERLGPVTEAVSRIEALGVRARLVRFDERVREQTPAEFLERLLPEVRVRSVVVTAGSAFGRNRSGTVEHLRALAAHGGFTVEVTDPEDDGGVISSTRIRRALAEGRIDEAARLLGRAPMVTGTVIHGDGRGRGLGYPTANLAFSYRPALPAVGIYLGRAEPVDGRARDALVSVGRRPTFSSDSGVLVEAHVLDWEGDLYGDELSVAFIGRLRDEQRFDSVADLVAQMQRDEAEARRRLGGGGGAGTGPV